MPTQRPFFQNFLAAFRAHSAIQQGKAGSNPSPSSSTTQPHNPTSPSQPRAIATSSKGGNTTAALSTLHSPRTHSASPLSRSPGTSPSANSTEMAHSPPAQGRYVPGMAARRGSDSSSEGFRDVLGKEKWYIGGRTATGEERYFKLGVVRRQRSADRLSLDRLSL
ncbi:Uncharacterized protein BP5553_08109 [Venustampulla echinocandica]|uniref:Uncharacterized protein n=1 Tax=Venustampulla echinocandica TaxID=2656787 RepID=A0A370TFT9_9HELO|nr:Uncharacterized protein BP5553_08109 [Venustampulla echinocandica]RDL33741.1 Uncharacterized protein BP5553_08109 [Venustampulla echinocandica]